MNAPKAAKLPSKSILAGRVLGLVVLLTVAASSGAAFGIASAQGPAEPVRAQVAAAAAAEEQVAETLDATLSVAEAPTLAATPGSNGAAASIASRAAGRAVSAPVLNLNVPSAGSAGGAVAAAGNAAKCSRFDDAKINWLIEQVAQTRAEHPEMAAGADKLISTLQGALGKNMCASEAQAIIGQLCTDPAVVRVMNQMVSQLPFFISRWWATPARPIWFRCSTRWAGSSPD